jgi:hypothetical protein
MQLTMALAVSTFSFCTCAAGRRQHNNSYLNTSQARTADLATTKR